MKLDSVINLSFGHFYPGGVERHGAFLSREREPDVALDELPPVEAGQSGARLLEGGGPSLPVVRHT